MSGHNVANYPGFLKMTYSYQIHRSFQAHLPNSTLLYHHFSTDGEFSESTGVVYDLYIPHGEVGYNTISAIKETNGYEENKSYI